MHHMATRRRRVAAKAHRTPFVQHHQASDSYQIVVRIKPELRAFIDRMVERLRAENPGVSITPSDVVRMGLAKLQAEREG
jgi:hypothetical protein